MPNELWESELTRSITEAFPDAALEFTATLGQHVIRAQPNTVIPLLAHLKDSAGFDFLVDLTAVDYPERPARFDLVYILYSFGRNQRVRIRAEVSEQADTATGVFPAANWLEREVFDMFGIVFLGHPNLKRILLPEDWTGHPLRKEYPIAQPDEAWVAANLEML